MMEGRGPREEVGAKGGAQGRRWGLGVLGAGGC